MVDLDPIPLADADDAGPTRDIPARPPVARARPTRAPAAGSGRHQLVAHAVAYGLAALHGLAIWWGLGGREGLTNGWPLWRDDHPLYYHSALVTRAFLAQSGTTAGYDPSFMAGYAKSVIFPASSTLPELVVWAFGGDHPELAYKVYVLVSAVAVPWLVMLAASAWGVRPFGQAVSVSFFLLYIWTDFPINYAAFGMLPYLLAVPLGLLAVGVFTRYLMNGGMAWWLVSAGLMSLSELVHLTAAMVVVPAAGLAYGAACMRREVDRPRKDPGERPSLPWSRHPGVWLIPIVVLAANAFWWLPGIWLATTKGASDFAFSHSRESVVARLVQIVTTEAPAQSLLLGLGLPGLLILGRGARVRGWALAGFCASGFFWGYLAGGWKWLDFLQPGRHSYALFTGLALAAGAAMVELRTQLRVASAAMGAMRLDRWVLLAGSILLARVMILPGGDGRSLVESVRARIFAGEPFLSSRPSPRLLWVVERVKRHVKPGERMLYEEGGFDLPGVVDPFQRGRFSGLLPDRTGVEVIGGPYLHAALLTNFTQFGEGALFGETDWDRDHFVRYARLYRPAAILCWSPRARRFCRSNPDLIRIADDDGTVLVGRVLGFEGDAIEGSARVSAEPGRLRVRDLSPGVDGSILLRYHSVPSLSARPSIPLEHRFEEGDPVPFILIRPPAGMREVELEMVGPFSVPWPRGVETDPRG
jgi:hypothetical protein